MNNLRWTIVNIFASLFKWSARMVGLKAKIITTDERLWERTHE